MAKKYQSQISWKKQDYANLQKAVSDFNKKVKQLEKKQGSLGLPELIEYKDYKKEIFTREELNRRMNILKSFTGDDIKQIVTLKDQTMTAWEKNLLEKQKPEAIAKINKQLSKRKKKFRNGVR